MTNTKHTPGPWTWRKTGPGQMAVYANEDSLASVFGQNQANDARLIAAAPELLAVAEMVMAYHRGEIAIFRELVEPARAAIARAKGEKS